MSKQQFLAQFQFFWFLWDQTSEKTSIILGILPSLHTQKSGQTTEQHSSLILLIIEEQALTNQERMPLSCCSQRYSPHPSHFLSKPSCIRHLLSCIRSTFKFFFLIFKTSFQKRKKSDPFSEHRLSAIPLPLLSVNREKISSQSWPKNRVAEILYSFSLSVEGEQIFSVFSVV